MKKLLLVALVTVLIGVSAGIANANLIQNSSFELNNAWASPADFSNWNEYGSFGVTSYAHTGSYAAWLGDNTNWTEWNPGSNSSLVSEKFNITETGTYEFGAWFALKSSTNPVTDYNSDKPGITANIYYTAGGADYYYYAYEISAAPVLSWTYYQDPHWGYLSNWILIAGTFDVTQLILNGELNISIQNWDPVYSAVYVDDAFLQKASAPVPEPATMLLLASGLVGLAGFGRKKFKK